MERAASWLLRQCVRSARPTTRFLVDTFVSPSVYLLLDRITAPQPGASAEERIAPLERVVFPVLHPSASRPVDLHIVEGNIRFRSWIRTAYLHRMFGASQRLRDAEKRFMTDLRVVPSLTDLNWVFNTKDWVRHPTEPEDMAQRSLVKAYESKDPSIQQWTMEQLLECIGCCVLGMNEFNLYCERNFVYEFFTADYIRTLCDYLVDRASAIHTETGKSTLTILEVGAGIGQLSALLELAVRRAKVQKPLPFEIQIVATDTGVWTARHKAKNNLPMLENVKRMGYLQSLEEFKPDIVLCSWMPMNQDWSKAFRETPSVQEYVLIGEINDGCCGHSWKTWGVLVDSSNDPMFERNKGNTDLTRKDKSIDLFHWLSKVGDPQDHGIPDTTQRKEEQQEYNSDHGEQTKECNTKVSLPWEPNFLRQDLPFSHLQLSRYDRKHYAANSHTVSFRRIK